MVVLKRTASLAGDLKRPLGLANSGPLGCFGVATFPELGLTTDIAVAQPRLGSVLVIRASGFPGNVPVIRVLTGLKSLGAAWWVWG